MQKLSYRYVLDEAHNVQVEPDPLKWAAFVGDPQLNIVKQETIGAYWVSTVFLGLDASGLFALGHDDDEPPRLFETMVFGDNEGKPKSMYRDQWCTWDEAARMHFVIVECLRAANDRNIVEDFYELLAKRAAETLGKPQEHQDQQHDKDDGDRTGRP